MDPRRIFEWASFVVVSIVGAPGGDAQERGPAPRLDGRSEWWVDLGTPDEGRTPGLVVPVGVVRFRLEIDRDESGAGATIVQGDERLPVELVEGHDERGWHYTLDFPHYDSRIGFRLEPLPAFGETRTAWFNGTWTKRRYDEIVEVPVRARRRFPTPSRLPAPDPDRPVAVRPGGPDSISGRWRVQFEHDPHPAVAVFGERDGGPLTGTFLTTLGDYRYLTGRRTGDTVYLSCFDGAHAFSFHMRVERGPSGALGDRIDGQFVSLPTWRESFVAERDPDAALPDAWSLTEVVGGVLPGDGSARFPALDPEAGGGKGELALDDPSLVGKARVVVVFGSWCPNCRDANALLAALDRRYRDRGLRVVGLACEHDRSLEENRAQVRRYVESQGVGFPVLIAGPSAKDEASAALPWLDAVRAYPTIVFADENGRVTRTYTGFSGPATGPAYEKLKAAFAAEIERLLSERDRE